MRKERVSATRLADMINSQIGARGVEVSVRKDHAYGWQPTILAAPSNVSGFQRRADEKRIDFASGLSFGIKAIPPQSCRK